MVYTSVMDFFNASATSEKNRKGSYLEKGEKTPVWLLALLTVFVYGFSQVLNTPVVTVYRFGIYGFCFFTGYFIFSHDEVV